MQACRHSSTQGLKTHSLPHLLLLGCTQHVHGKLPPPCSCQKDWKEKQAVDSISPLPRSMIFVLFLVECFLLLKACILYVQRVWSSSKETEDRSLSYYLHVIGVLYGLMVYVILEETDFRGVSTSSSKITLTLQAARSQR